MLNNLLLCCLQNWPNAEVPNFQSTVTSIYRLLADLGLRVLSVMAIGLQLVSCQITLSKVHGLRWKAFTGGV